MCTWMASDDDFFVIRRFEKLGARVALLMQNRIVQLEEQLRAEDVSCTNQGGDNGTFQGDSHIRRQEVMDELAWRLERYQRFVLDHSELKARPDATKRQITYVKNWLENNNQPIRPAEAAFVEKEDLMPVVPVVKPPLRRLIDRFDWRGRIFCWRRRNKKVHPYTQYRRAQKDRANQKQLTERHYNHPDNFESETTIYSEEGRIDKFVTCITIGLGLVMLIAPLWLLQYVYSEQIDLKARLKIITGFLIGFTILLSVVAVARPFEVLAATAAYGAVLMVFMQLGNPG
ncbi:MAG: hypothetical protein Q9168_006474 [Polycauliona sp. 1 TL-2023]